MPLQRQAALQCFEHRRLLLGASALILPAPMAASGIDSLPDSVWELVLFALCQKSHGNPSDAFRLSVASRSLRASVGRLRFWQERCRLQGW